MSSIFWKTNDEIEKKANEYTFKKCAVANHQSDLIKEAYTAGYRKAMVEYSETVKGQKDTIEHLMDRESDWI